MRPLGWMAAMRLEQVDPMAVTEATAADLAAMVTAAQAVDAPHQAPETPRGELLYLRYGWENRPPDAGFVARDEDDRVIGRTYVELPRYDNLDLGVLGVECHPDHRAGGTAQVLLDAGLDELRRVGRSGVLVE